MNSDADLLARYVRENSNAAFAELVQRHMGMVYGAALRQLGGAHHLAEDAAQNAFVALARKARTLQHRHSLAGWLYLSTHHAAAQLARTESRRRTREEAHTMEEQQLTTDAAPVWDRMQEVLDPAMARLRDADREAVLLRFVERRSFAEIGSVLDVTADAARMRVDRALEKLRSLLEQRGITSTSAALASALSSHATVFPTPAFTGRVSHVATAMRATDTASPLGSAWGALAGVAAVAIGVGLYQTRTADEARSDLRAATQHRDQALAQLELARNETAALQRQLQELQSSAKAGSAPSVTPSRPAAMPAPNPATAPRVGAWTFTSPDGRRDGTHYFEDSAAGRRESIRLAVAERYAPYFRQMGWTSDQQAKFADLFFQKKEAAQRAIQDFTQSGNPLSRELMKQFVERAERDFEAKLAAALGAPAVDALHDFDAKIGFRNLADQLAKRLFDSQTPLVSWQADQLVELMANNTRKVGARFDAQSLDTERVLNQAQAFLSPPQSSALRDVVAELQKQRELEQRMLAQKGMPPPPGTPTPGK